MLEEKRRVGGGNQSSSSKKPAQLYANLVQLSVFTFIGILCQEILKPKTILTQLYATNIIISLIFDVPICVSKPLINNLIVIRVLTRGGGKSEKFT